MKTLTELAASWREEAEHLRERYGLEEMASLCRVHAAELDEAIRDVMEEELTLAEAAEESGYSDRRLRQLVAKGSLPNAGEKGRPRLRRGDLPRKPRKDPGAFDADAEVRRIRGKSAA